MNYYLAIDGGGTKTQVLCADQTGQIVGEGISGPVSLAATNPGAASFNLREAVRQATEQLPPDASFITAAMGLAGMDVDSEVELATATFSSILQTKGIQSFILVNDIVIALEGGTDAANALALISGTGSNCYGRNQVGQTAKTGGMDYILTDQGSGYAIGLAVLRQAVKSFDGRIHKTMLEQFVCEHFRIATLAELKPKVYSPLLTKTEIAELAQVCLRAFDQGDAEAQKIFNHAIEELFLMATAVINKLALQKAEVSCVLAGSITKNAYIQEALVKKLAEYCPLIKIVIPTHAPVYGALKLAMKPKS